MNFNYIDIHSHLNFKDFDEDRENVIKQMKDEEIATISVGTDLASSIEVVRLSEMHENLFACVGVHPADLLSKVPSIVEGQTDVLESSFDYEKFLELAKHPKVVAIGECGFDYFRDQSEELKVKQKEIFEAHIKLAIEVGKPLMIHARASKGTQDAYHDTLNIIEDYQKEHPELCANFHFFAGDASVLERILNIGCTVSFDGPITFARDYDEVIQKCSYTSIMAETDSPFAAPNPYRGKRNSPMYVKEIYKKIAEIRGENEEEVRNQINQNAQKFFKLS